MHSTKLKIRHRYHATRASRCDRGARRPPGLEAATFEQCTRADLREGCQSNEPPRNDPDRESKVPPRA